MTHTTVTSPTARLVGEDLAYFEAARSAITQGRIAGTSQCSERNQDVAPGDEDHAMFGEVVVIGCAGYYLISPAAVGIHLPNWEPVQK